MIIGKILRGKENEMDREKARNHSARAAPRTQAVRGRRHRLVRGSLHIDGMRCTQAEPTEAPGPGVHGAG